MDGATRALMPGDYFRPYAQKGFEAIVWRNPINGSHSKRLAETLNARGIPSSDIQLPGFQQETKPSLQGTLQVSEDAFPEIMVVALNKPSVPNIISAVTEFVNSTFKKSGSLRARIEVVEEAGGLAAFEVHGSREDVTASLRNLTNMIAFAAGNKMLMFLVERRPPPPPPSVSHCVKCQAPLPAFGSYCLQCGTRIDGR